MIRIALVDDDVEFLEILEQKIKYIALCHNWDILIDKMTTIPQELVKNYNAVFLDIIMPKKDGMVIAEEMLINNSDIKIIFVSSRDVLVYDCIKYRPFRFIRKSHINSELEEAVVSLYENYLKDEFFVEVKTSDKNYIIPAGDIVFIESNGHNIYFNLKDNNILITRATIYDYEKRLKDYAFARSHKSYLINLKYVYNCNSKVLIMNDGKEFTIGRMYRDSFTKKYIDYIGGMYDN